MSRGPEDDWSIEEHIKKHGDENAEIAEKQRGWLDAGTAASASLMLAVSAGLVSGVATVVGFVNRDPMLVKIGLIGLTSSVIGGGILNHMMKVAGQRSGG